MCRSGQSRRRSSKLFAALDLAALLLGIAALVSAVGGFISTILALRKTRSEDEQLCLERLKKAREEAETAAAELHERRMREAKDDED